MAAKDVLGRRGEDLAADFLTRAGYVIVHRNWRCRLGEIDLVAVDGDEIVFVEVKTRTSVAFGHPLEAITYRKLSRMRSLAAQWCADHPAPRRRVRIDVIAIIAPAGRQPELQHLRRVS